MTAHEHVSLTQTLARIDRGELVRLTQDLVRIPSVVRPDDGGNEQTAAEFVAGFLERHGLPVFRDEAAPGRPNVWAVLEGTQQGKTLLFEAHTDVVTEGDPASWSQPPFAGAVVGSRIYGRGACDTKGNLAAAVLAVLAIKRAGLDFPGRIVLCHPVDEEGLMLGIKRFIAAGHAEGVDAAIICEPEENQLCIAQKGALRVAVRFSGRMAHGAMPLSGVNPITRAARFVVAVEALERDEIERHGRDPLLGYPSLTPTVLRAPDGGEPQLNVIPAAASVALDIRTIPSQSHQGLLARLRECLDWLRADDPLLRAELTVLDDRPCTETPRDSAIVRAASDAYRTITGSEPRFNGVPGATDGTFLHAWAGIPIVTTGAGQRTVPHHADEWVDIDELETTCRLYAATAMRYLGAD
ncbi:MAG TPA: M20 family metallopeptidase [Nitrolancea sp.]|nr:M20 family metallopeptidase [Nitrolancea sp.]